MSFSEKLKKAMHDLELNQRQVCGLTGKSKGSVSQYLSGKQIPSEKAQSDIAVSLGLDPDYFSAEDEKPVIAKEALTDGKIKRLNASLTVSSINISSEDSRLRITPL